MVAGIASTTKPLLIGIAGGSCAGKTTLAGEVQKQLSPLRIELLQFDSYYKSLQHLPREERQAQNFDCLEILETDLLEEHLRRLRAGKSISVPVYDYTSHTRSAETRVVAPTPVVMVEGILLLAAPSLPGLLDLRVFLDVPADIRLARRIERDIRERGRTADSVITQYLKTVRPMHEKLVEPSRKAADLVVHGGGLDPAAIRAVVGRIKELLK